REKRHEAHVATAVDALRAEPEAIEALAICFLYAFLDPAHERRAAELVQAHLPGLCVALSSDVSPEFREYERLSTTVLNAYLGPLIGRYVRRFADRVRELGVAGAPYINKSTGGIISVAEAAARPVRTLLSGPAAGVMGAAWVASQAGIDAIITFD